MLPTDSMSCGSMRVLDQVDDQLSHRVMSGLFVTYTHHLLEFTQDLFHQEELQWFNEGQLHVTV